MLAHLRAPEQVEVFLRPLVAEAANGEALRAAQLLEACRLFSCGLSKYLKGASCYACLHRPLRSLFGDFPNALFQQASRACLDMNALYFCLFRALHEGLQALVARSGAEAAARLALPFYCVALSSLVQHSLSLISFVLNQEGNSLLRSFHCTQDLESAQPKVRNSWVYLAAAQLHEFVQRYVLSMPALCAQAATAALLVVLSLVSLEVMCDGLGEEGGRLQFAAFSPLVKVVDSIEGCFQEARSEAAYRQQEAAYGGLLHGALCVLGALCANLELYPSLKPLLSLLTIQLYKWLVTNEANLLYDLALQHLARLVRYARIIHRKELWVVLPECIVAEMAKTLLAAPVPKQRRVAAALFASSSPAEWYEQLATYVLPVFINQLETRSILELARAIAPQRPVSDTLAELFQGNRCTYNVLVYLLKHMSGEGTEAWELFFALQSPFEEAVLSGGQLPRPQSSRVSIKEEVHREGHRLLWPLLYDCTDVILHDREMSEAALQALYAWGRGRRLSAGCTRRAASTRARSCSSAPSTTSTSRSTRRSPSTRSS